MTEFDARPDVVDILIGRLLDGEATDADRVAFAEHAATDASLMARFAEAQRTDVLLEQVVSAQLDRMQLVAAPSEPAPVITTWRRAAAVGWAATILLALVVWANRDDASTSADTSWVNLPSEEHIERYLTEPWTDELDPMVTFAEELEDGRWRIRYVRRLEEIGIFTGDAPPEDVETHHLTVKPASLEREVYPRRD